MSPLSFLERLKQSGIVQLLAVYLGASWVFPQIAAPDEDLCHTRDGLARLES